MVLRVCLLALPLAAAGGAAGAVAFSRADTDHDGVVTFEEATRVFPQLAPVHFRKSDPNGDGVIERGEYPLLENLYWTLTKGG